VGVMAVLLPRAYGFELIGSQGRVIYPTSNPVTRGSAQPTLQVERQHGPKLHMK